MSHATKCYRSKNKVVDVEKILPPVILALFTLSSHPGRYRASGKELEQGGVEEDDDRIDSSEANVSVNIELDPEGKASPIIPVKLLQSKVSQKRRSNEEERVHTRKSIKHNIHGSIEQELITKDVEIIDHGMVVRGEGAVDVANNNPGEGQESDSIDAGEWVRVNILCIEQLDGVGVDWKTLEHLNTTLRIQQSFNDLLPVKISLEEL